ncbi:hypothetical protein AB0M28_38825 [Streptomyces sp. NPDC051940]|uniref:tetratricopeptide repeat protein n=1 Tax=Streptomyces sp. NPDC051940 TaxID=3155675 RepID=UPI003428360D
MTDLDPGLHDPEEYEGKTFTVDGCAYEVGPLIGSGLSKFVHVLVNRRSGLRLHVLAVYRDAEAGRQELTNEIAAKAVADLLGGVQVPNIREVPLPGALAALQDYYGSQEAEPSPGLLRGEALLGEEKWPEAVEALTAVLRERPAHTMAMNNCAYALARCDRLYDAVDLMAQAVGIEPNHLPYLRSLIQYAAAATMPATALRTHRTLKEKYPRDTSCEEIVAHMPAQASGLHNLSVDLARAGRLDEAVETVSHAVDAYGVLAEGDPEQFDVELAESLFNLGAFTLARGDAVGAVGPLVDVLSIATAYERQDLFDLAADTFRDARARAPEAVAAEFLRLTEEPLADWLT